MAVVKANIVAPQRVNVKFGKVKAYPVGGSLVSFEQKRTSGEVIGVITIDGEEREIYGISETATSARNGLMSAAQVQTLERAERDIGDLEDLETAQENLVAAINALNGNIGDLSHLSTTAKGNLVAALNEQNSETQGMYYKLGDTFNENVQWVPLAINAYGNMMAFIPTSKLLPHDARLSVSGTFHIRENGTSLLSDVSVTDSTVSLITAAPMRAGIMLRIGLASQPSGFVANSVGILYVNSLKFTVG